MRKILSVSIFFTMSTLKQVTRLKICNRGLSVLLFGNFSNSMPLLWLIFSNIIKHIFREKFSFNLSQCLVSNVNTHWQLNELVVIKFSNLNYVWHDRYVSLMLIVLKNGRNENRDLSFIWLFVTHASQFLLLIICLITAVRTQMSEVCLIREEMCELTRCHHLLFLCSFEYF